MPTRPLHVVITGDPKPFQKALAQAGASSAQFGAKQKTTAQKVGAAGSTLTRGLTLPLIAGAGAAVHFAAKFEKQMSAVAAVTNAPRAKLEELRKQALKAGADTAYSAREAAVAQTELAKGGIKTADILSGGLNAALSLAAAGELDLGEAAAITANSMNLFGMRGKDATHVADAMATAANATTADVSDFGLALSQAGSVAKSAGLSFDETMTALEALAANGIKGSDAGTSLKAAMIQLIKPTEKQKNLTQKLGLSFLDAHGNFKSLADVSTMLRDKLGGMTSAQRTATLAQLAGTDGVRTLTSLYDAGPTALNKYATGLGKAGTAAETARTKQRNLAGQLEQLKGSFETFAIVVGTALLPPLTEVAKHLTSLGNTLSTAFSGLPPAMQQLVLAGVIGVAALGPLLAVGARIATMFGQLRSGAGLLAAAFTPLRLALIVIGVALAVFGGHGGEASSTMGGLAHAAQGVGTAFASIAGAVGAVLSPFTSIAGAFARSQAAAVLLRGALVALVGAGIGLVVGKALSAVTGLAGMARGLFSLTGAAMAAERGMQALKLAVVTNPVMALFTALGFVAGAMGLFSSKTDQAKMSQTDLKNTVLATRDAMYRLQDAELGLKDADLAVKTATLGLKQAEANKQQLQKSGKASSLELAQADLGIKSARLEVERATRRASRAHADHGATTAKDTAEVRENIKKLRDNVTALKSERDALAKNSRLVPGNSKLKQQLADKNRELAGAERDLATASRNAGTAADKAGGKVKAGADKAEQGKGPLSAIARAMRGLGNIRVSMGGFIQSIVGGLSNAWNSAVAWVGKIREKLKSASPGKRHSPSPNDIIAGGFVGMAAVFDTGFARVEHIIGGARQKLTSAMAAVAKITGEGFAFGTDAQIRDANARLESFNAGNELTDRQDAIDKARKATHSKRHGGEKKSEYRARIKEARTALAELVKTETRANAAATIQFEITGLERVRDFNNALNDIRSNLADVAGSATEKFIDQRLQAANYAIDTSAEASELAAIKARQNARTAAQDNAAMTRAKLRETNATATLTKAQAALDRARATGSARLIASATTRLASATAGATAATQARQELQDTQRAATLETELDTRRAAAQAGADAARQGFDAEVNSFKASLTARLNAEAQQLGDRKQSYSDFVRDVTAILSPLGEVLNASPEQEAAISAAAPAGPALVRTTKKPKKPRKRRRASGGQVLARLGELTRLSELGKETAYLPKGVRVVQASESGRTTDRPTIGQLVINAEGSAARNPQSLAAMIGFQVATARR